MVLCGCFEKMNQGFCEDGGKKKKKKLFLDRVLIGEDKSEYLYVKTRVYVVFFEVFGHFQGFRGQPTLNNDVLDLLKIKLYCPKNECVYISFKGAHAHLIHA